MRKKAEKKIRQAVDQLGGMENHRLDRVRAGAGLHPKVFDKTILDMERVGTIELFTGDLKQLTDGEIANLVRRGNTVYMTFSFTEAGRRFETASVPPEKESPQADSGPIDRKPTFSETRVLILQGLLPGEWDRFERICRTERNRSAEAMIEDMIRRYLRK